VIRNILAIVDCGDKDAQFVKDAAGFAEFHGAHLTITIVSAIPSPDYELTFSEPFVLIDQFMERAKAKEARLGALVRDGMVDIRTLQHVTPTLLDMVPVHARYSDLVLMGPENTYRSAWLRKHLAQALMMTSGRPVLMVPPGYSPRPIDRLAVGWNATREATRALNDALILAVPGAKIDILSIDAHQGLTGHGAQPGADIALHLARHGFEVDVVDFPSAGRSVSEVLTHQAEHRHADLLVIGAYAHSRLRDLILGGVTADLMPGSRNLTLFSH